MMAGICFIKEQGKLFYLYFSNLLVLNYLHEFRPFRFFNELLFIFSLAFLFKIH